MVDFLQISKTYSKNVKTNQYMCNKCQLLSLVLKKYDMTVYAATTTTTHSRGMTTILARQSLAFGRISPAMQVLADPRVQRLCPKYVSTRNCGLLCIFLLFGGKQQIS